MNLTEPSFYSTEKLKLKEKSFNIVPYDGQQIATMLSGKRIN